ncbi:uncharacterized protein SPSK_04910 [Sporothrix schenckii 1099-18]|uniref:Wings apart-like protein C-terminal domain-containing protein n=1 Tax=Sporothrix schenckii 1099-18 TaxID=1397361 RepID=A0A0F2LU71_SPOSC|nr:uncharacterized protein SPSK_04910 [Sporothrix schenckii 1099-18]KJR80409.1 hypothetical protein SPSK_04910 [Sporothrix schenckii 1099-18]
MSTFNDLGQRPKKKPPTTFNGKPGLKSRSQTSTPPITGASESSQSGSQTPAKDIYEYDFVDDVPPPPKSVTKPRPLSSARPPLTTPRPSNKSTASTGLAPSPMPASTATPRHLPTIKRGNTTRETLDAVRGVKRKPSPNESTPMSRPNASVQRPSTSTQRPSASAQRPSAGAQRPAAGVAASSPPVSRNSYSTQAKKVQRRSPSPGPTSVGASSPLFRQSKAIGKATESSSSRPVSSPRQRATKTPPKEPAGLKSPLGIRSPSASPRKTLSKFAAVSATTAVRKSGSKSPHPMPIRPVDNLPSNSGHATPRKSPQRPASVAREIYKPPPSTQRKRRRLIDTLASQIEDESSSDEEAKPAEDPAVKDESEGNASSDEDPILARYRNVRSTPVSEGRGGHMDLDSLATASPSKVSIAPSTPATITRRTTTRRPGVKFTYNLERTILAEEPVELGGPQGSDLSLLESLLPEPEAKPAAFDFDEDMGGASQGAIQSIHELRQAGANSRYADELVDIMDRVGAPSSGKPSSARRSALLEMVHKLQEKSFLRHFRDQGAEMQLFRNVGKETDVVAGYTIAGIVVTLLASGSASHRLLRELRQHKIKDLFLTLLATDSDIVSFSKDRKANVSNHMRQQLGTLKETLRKLSAIWKPASGPPSQLSPRTVALKALHMFAQQLQSESGGVSGIDEDDGALSAALTKELFGIISSALPSANDDDGSTPEPPLLASGLSSDADSADLFLSLSLLEMHSVSAMQSDISAEWTRHYLPIIASALGESLERHEQSSLRLNDLELLVLKLALNTANNNPDAARYYVDKGLLRQLAELSSGALTGVVRSAKTGEEFASDALNELLLMLGVMINFSENDAAAGETLEQGGGLAVFDRLGKAFLDGTAVASEADSEEKSQLNVAFAYLSILLGYLCLHDPIYQAFKLLSPSGNLNPLLESIRQFITLHDQIGKAENLEHGAEASQFTARLRALTQELDARSY